MKQKTIEKYQEIIDAAKQSNKSLKRYCEENDINYNSVYSFIQRYNNIKADVEIIRDGNRIIEYKVSVYKRDKNPFIVILTREEVETLYGLYTYYGGNITARNVANEFPRFTLPEIKGLFRAFGITKDSIWAPQHLVEELTLEELDQYRMNLKERAAFKYADAQQERDFKNTLNKIVRENLNLKKQLDTFSSFEIKGNLAPVEIKKKNHSQKVLNLYLSDLHVGAITCFGALYDENRIYNQEEIQRRLTESINRIHNLDNFDTINLILLGDMLDCCGILGKTARLDHNMPQGMDPKEQVNCFLEVTLWYIDQLSRLCNNINIYSVPEGNHDGNMSYIAVKALMYAINAKYPKINTIVWDKFYGTFTVDNQTFLCTHGKDASFLKKGLPLNLNDKTQIMIYEWLHENGLHQDNIHIIKGDLHSNNINSCKRFTYRNVLSLFGASDYSNYNFSRNSWGISFDIIHNNNVLSGNFENL